MYYVHDLDPVAFEIFGFKVMWYAFAYVFGLIFGQYYLKVMIRKKNIDFKVELIDALINYIILGMILGARLIYVICYSGAYNANYFQNASYVEIFLDLINIREGGVAFHGGLLGGALAVYYFCKKHKVDYRIIFDMICCCMPFGIFLGRIANFINGELYGTVTDKKWAVVFWDGKEMLPRHPAQIYEALSEGLFLFFVLNFILWRSNVISSRTGFISVIFLISYAIIRFCNEYFRDAELYRILYFSLSMGQILSVLMFFTGIYMLLFIDNTNKNIVKN